MRTYAITTPVALCLGDLCLITSYEFILRQYKKKNSAKKDLFSKIKDYKIYLYQGYLQDYSRKKRITDTKNTLHTNNFIEKDKSWKYIGGLLSIIIDEAYL